MPSQHSSSTGSEQRQPSPPSDSPAAKPFSPQKSGQISPPLPVLPVPPVDVVEEDVPVEVVASPPPPPPSPPRMSSPQAGRPADATTRSEVRRRNEARRMGGSEVRGCQ